MTAPSLSRRRFLVGAASLGSIPLLSSCVGSGVGESSGGQASATITLQSSVQDTGPKAALEKIVAAYGGAGAPVTMNSVAREQFRAQLSTYLSSATPPDVLTWYAGSVANSYAAEGLLLDVSDLWTGDGACAGFSDALRSLSTSGGGQAIFVPTSYYWWSIFYKKSAFASWGVEPPTTWDGFIALCDDLKGRGIHPLTNGIGTTPWMSSGWFDPSVPSAEEAPTDGYFAAARTDNPDGAKAMLSYIASPEVQQRYITESGTSNLPTSPEVDTSQFAPIVQKGIELLNSTSEITQFFNRDSSDALQTTADAALTRFLADPSDIPGQLRDWQAAAEQVFSS
jgi:ABC-type glycerol-3-phosphate transport system substrate-binding protein